MRGKIWATAIGFTLIGSAQAQDLNKMLQGLTTGNQHDDDRLHEAYMRGYRNGQRDAESRYHNNNYQNAPSDYRNTVPLPPPPPPGYNNRQ